LVVDLTATAIKGASSLNAQTRSFCPESSLNVVVAAGVASFSVTSAIVAVSGNPCAVAAYSDSTAR